MSDTPATPRSRHQRPAASRLHRPARAAVGRSHGLPSPRRVLAEQVVAWHNRHPLARRIGRRHLGGYGVVSLPFSPAPGDATTGSGWAESTSTRFPMFDELSFLPGVPVQKVIALALAEGWVERPGAPEWPLRKVPVGKGWDAAQAERIHLLTACIKRGGGRAPLRVLIGRHGPIGEHQGVVGHRVLSRPRMAVAALVAALPMLLVAWGAVGLIQGWRGAQTEAPLVAQAPPSVAPGELVAEPPPVATDGRTGAAPLRLPPPALEQGPGELLPPTDEAIPGAAAAPRGMPKVGLGTDAAPPMTRAAAPSSYRLMAAPQPDPAELAKQALRLQAVLDTLGHTGARLRLDVVGTPEGDALAIGPPLDQAEAERVAKRLKARGFVLQLAQQP
jgi:hypothetical protein